MQLEIERRFLLRHQSPRFIDGLVAKDIQQGYFPTLPGISLRVRIVNEQHGVITHKYGDGLTREETEVSISIEGARDLIACCPYRLRKKRYQVGRFEVDFLSDELEGVHLAEIELKHADESFEKPEWLEGAVDVTESVNNLALAKLASKIGDKMMPRPLRELLRPNLPLIALTGGPCSGKTTAIRELKAELGERVRFVPEAARFLIEEMGLRPDPGDIVAWGNFQEKLYLTQRTLEETALDEAHSRGQKAVIADRGTLDSLAYLEGGEKEFERISGARVDHELMRYKRVIVLSPAPKQVYANDSARRESYEEACELGDRIRLAWGKHPNLRLTRLDGWPHKLSEIREHVLAAISD
jgi:CYTH domain-containing protein/predicted ATPase